jgi:hypothetical protein
MIVVGYLRENSIVDLNCTLSIDHSLSKDGRKVSLNYNQIATPRRDILARECRGLILSRVDHEPIDITKPFEAKVLARTFTRFFNYGEEECQEFDFSSAIAEDKLDGSLLIHYFDDANSKWTFATRSSPDAEGNVYDFKFSFHDLATSVFTKNQIDSNLFDKDKTYLFELTSAYNQVVVPYEESSVTLLGIRSRITGQEYKTVSDADVNIPRVKQWKFSTLEDISKFVESRTAKEAEGVVLVDSNFNRCKVKSSHYIHYHKKVGGRRLTKRAILGFILQGVDDDLLPYVSKFERATFLRYREKLAVLDKQFKDDVSSLQGLTKKEVAMQLQNKHPFKSAIFAMIDTNCTFLEYIKNFSWVSVDQTWRKASLDKIIDLMGENNADI